LGTKNTTKSAASTVESLQAQLAALQQQIASLTSAELTVSAEAVGRFTREHWHTLRFAMVVGGADKPTLRKDRKGYALVKGANPAWYMACKGFENTLRSREENSLPIELSAEPNSKGRSQVQYAQEILTAMVEGGFIDPKSALITGKSAKKAAK
jgi:hypothetical protein